MQYTLDMEYNLDHTIKKKTQNQTLGKVASYGGAMSNSRPVKKTSYILDYGTYGGGQFVTDTNGDPNSPNNYGYQQPHTPRSITETPSWDPNVAQDDPRIRKKKIAYDAKGNQTEISETIGTLTVSLRRNLWGEEGQAYKDNVMVYPNGLMMGKAIKIGKRDAAPVSTLDYTKHYYIGSERISAKTGTLEDFGAYPQSLLTSTISSLSTVSETHLRVPSQNSVTDALTNVGKIHQDFNIALPKSTIPPV